MKIKNLRWWIVGLIALATAINYLDRQTLPVAIGELRKSFSVTDSQYGMINSLFLFAYGTMYAVGGRLLDVLGTRVGYAIMIIWWSLANMLHGLVSGVWGLGVVRFLLGIGEGGGFPGSAKAVSEWFPAKERAFAFGIFNTGSSVGAVLAPPLLALIITALDWRWAFVLTGLLGLIWVILWLKVYEQPSRNKLLTEAEKKHVIRSLKADTRKEQVTLPWISLFKCRQVWGLLTVKFLTDAGWFFFIFWLPKYLNDIRGLDIIGIGSYAWIPYAFAGAGSFLGGWFSSYLLKRTGSLNISRKIPMAIAASMLPLSLLIVDAPLTGAIVFFGLAMFGHQLWSTIVQTLAADMFPSSIIGSVSGLMGCIGTYGAMLFSFCIGFVIEQYGYGPAFLISGTLHPISLLIILLLIKKVESVKLLKSI
ncbi:MFS transporter [Parapedobacter sp. DT-150]|uniref:MFS transporter n=1 Tax=Parapedobacter sp. DT-150 TaxID=3396162 RepID=UPI003F195284